MKKEKVYCGECNFFCYDLKCDYPDNKKIVITWKSKKEIYIKDCSQLNKKNTCTWFKRRGTIYCGDCKFFECIYSLEYCNHPENFDNGSQRSKFSCSSLNGKNNCVWFERLIGEPKYIFGFGRVME